MAGGRLKLSFPSGSSCLLPQALVCSPVTCKTPEASRAVAAWGSAQNHSPQCSGAGASYHHVSQMWAASMSDLA